MRDVLMCLGVVFCAATASAQDSGVGGGGSQTPAAGNERIRQVLELDSRVSIIDVNGKRVDGSVREFSAGTLRVFARGRLEDIQMDHIVRIERSDGVGDGALAGAGVGVTLGVLGGLLNAGEAGDRWRFVAASAFGNGLILAGLGAGLDALFDNSETLYERRESVQLRVSPLVARGVTGAALSLRW